MICRNHIALNRVKGLGTSSICIKICIPGESWDPLINDSVGGTVDPGFRRECNLSWLGYRSKRSDVRITYHSGIYPGDFLE